MNSGTQRMVKGIILADYVRMIRNRKDINWDKYLLPEDRPYLKQRIIESEWYPLRTLERMSMGIIKEIAKNDLEVVRSWGRTSMDRLTQLNKSLVSENQPMESMMRFQVIRGSLFSFDPIKTVLITHDNAKLELNYHMNNIADKAAAYHTLGYIERLLQLSGAKVLNFEFNKMIWEGAPATELEIEWSNTPVAKSVRGALFVDYVRMIKSKKDADWKKYLLPQDLPYLEMRIAPDKWYPFPTFERMGVGIIAEIAGGNYEAVRIWGRETTRKLIAIHKSVICEGDPMESLMRFQILRGSFFDFDPIHLLSISPYYASFKVNYGTAPIVEKAATYQALGYFEMLLDLSGAKNINYNFTQTIWDGADETILQFSWE